MLTDFRKTALLAGIAIALSSVWSFIAQFLTRPEWSSLDLITSTTLPLFILVLELPMPFFLLLLYRTGIRPSPSRNLHSLIMVLTAILSVSFLLFLRDEWRSWIFLDTRNVGSSARFGAVFLVPPGSPLWAATLIVSSALRVGSRLLTILFFVAFAKQTAPPAIPERASAHRVKRAAVIAIAARVLMIIFSFLSFMIYAHAERTYGKTHTTPGDLPMLRNLLFGLPALILPWIVYRGIRTESQPGRVTQIVEPAEPSGLNELERG